MEGPAPSDAWSDVSGSFPGKRTGSAPTTRRRDGRERTHGTARGRGSGASLPLDRATREDALREHRSRARSRTPFVLSRRRRGDALLPSFPRTRRLDPVREKEGIKPKGEAEGAAEGIGTKRTRSSHASLLGTRARRDGPADVHAVARPIRDRLVREGTPTGRREPDPPSPRDADILFTQRRRTTNGSALVPLCTPPSCRDPMSTPPFPREREGGPLLRDRRPHGGFVRGSGNPRSGLERRFASRIPFRTAGGLGVGGSPRGAS